MPKTEQSLSPLPNGAGRISDWVYPDPMQVFTTGIQGTTFRNRLNSGTITAVTGGYGGGGATLATVAGAGASVTGSPAVTLVGTGSGGQLVRATNGPSAWFSRLRTKAAFPANSDDYSVTSVSAIVAYIGVVGSATQTGGLAVTQDGGLMGSGGAGTSAGFGFYRTAANVLQIGVLPVANGVLTLFPAMNGGTYNEQQLHKQQFVFTSATATSDTTVTAYLDGIPLRTFVLTAAAQGVTMPTLGGSLPFIPVLAMTLNGVLHIKIPAGFRVSHGPSITDAL